MRKISVEQLKELRRRGCVLSASLLIVGQVYELVAVGEPKFTIGNMNPRHRMNIKFTAGVAVANMNITNPYHPNDPIYVRTRVVSAKLMLGSCITGVDYWRASDLSLVTAQGLTGVVVGSYACLSLSPAKQEIVTEVMGQ